MNPSTPQSWFICHTSLWDTLYDYKSYDDCQGPKDRNSEKPPSPKNPQFHETNPDPSVGDRFTGQRVGTPIPGPSKPRSIQIKAPDTPMKKKPQAEKPTKKKRPSPIKYPEATDHDEDPSGEDVPLSRLITTPKTSRPIARQDLRNKLNDKPGLSGF